jgi:APA family basic amino acid/polyamine antiporter
MVLVVVDYVEHALPGLTGTLWVDDRIAGPALVLVLSLLNVVGVRAAGRVTAWLTAIPIAGLVLLFGIGLFRGEADLTVPETQALEPERLPLLLGAAMIPIFFSYSGWNAAAYLAGEVRDPGRNLARALLGGTLLVTLLYLALNLLFIVVVPASRLAGSTTAGADAASALLGPGAERVLSALIAVAVLGSAHVTMMAGSRIYYAMAHDRLAPRGFGRLNRAGAPARALWGAAAWTAVLAASGTVGLLVHWTTLAILLLSSLTAGAIFVFRRRDPAGTSFRCPGYPWTPLLYIAACLGVAVASTLSQPLEALYGLLVLVAGLPFYYVLRRSSRDL